MLRDDPNPVIERHLKQLDQNTFLFSYRVPKHLREKNLSLPASIRKKIPTSDYEIAVQIAQALMFEIELLISVYNR